MTIFRTVSNTLEINYKGYNYDVSGIRGVSAGVVVAVSSIDGAPTAYLPCAVQPLPVPEIQKIPKHTCGKPPKWPRPEFGPNPNGCNLSIACMNARRQRSKNIRNTSLVAFCSPNERVPIASKGFQPSVEAVLNRIVAVVDAAPHEGVKEEALATLLINEGLIKEKIEARMYMLVLTQLDCIDTIGEQKS